MFSLQVITTLFSMSNYIKGFAIEHKRFYVNNSVLVLDYRFVWDCRIKVSPTKSVSKYVRYTGLFKIYEQTFRAISGV